MDLLAVTFSLAGILPILYVAVGLGLVIFIHELGHFAVAKWCGVKVERFSIGFGPVLWKITHGETEYALSAIPLGGYVKMLGQDDADPSQLTDTRIARDPRSYTSKTVLQRMAIISAGVFNNLVSAALFFVIAFYMGVREEPAIIGHVEAGSPAWQVGLRSGDRITEINGIADDKYSFQNLSAAIALSSGDVRLGIERDGKALQLVVKPVAGDMFRQIGAGPSQSLVVAGDSKGKAIVTRGLPAADARPPLMGGDRIIKVNDVPVANWTDLRRETERERDHPIVLTVARAEGDTTKEVEITTGVNHMLTLGLSMDIGKISAIQDDSPASGKLRKGDKITHVGTADKSMQAVGTEIDPLRLPEFFRKNVGQEVTIRVKRDVENGAPATEEIHLVPEARTETDDLSMQPGAPVSATSVGIAYQVLHHVLSVDPESTAAKDRKNQVSPGDNIIEADVLQFDGKVWKAPGKPVKFDNEKNLNWSMLFAALQLGDRPIKVKLTVQKQGAADKERRVVELPAQPDLTWPIARRGFATEQLMVVRKAKNLGDAFSLAAHKTKSQVAEMYLSLRRLATGGISLKGMGGPLSIFGAGYHFASRGFADLLAFLGILSISLAVLNFLPIPVLDGGHFVFLLWEGIRGKPPHERVMLVAQYIGLSMILTLMLWVLYLDISRYIVPRG